MSCEVIKNQANFVEFYYCRTHKVECEEFGCAGTSPEISPSMPGVPFLPFYMDSERVREFQKQIIKYVWVNLPPDDTL